MQSRFFHLCVLTSIFAFTAGCESPWYQAEPVADALIPPSNPWSCETSRKDVADTVGKPADIHFFGDQAVYMGDHDGYRYIHLRDMSDFWGFLGECDFRVPEKQWPMEHPMPLTSDATKWMDVTWLGSDGPEGVAQNPALHITPTFPLGAPKTQPALIPTTIDFTTRPAPDNSSTEPWIALPGPPAGAATQNSQPSTAPEKNSGTLQPTTVPTQPTTEPRAVKIQPTTQPSSQSQP